MATVIIPLVLRPFCDGHERLEVPGHTLRQVFDRVGQLYPALREQLIEDGDIRPGLNIAVDSDLASDGLLQAVGEDSEVLILPAIGGGRT
jgi:hypothetical protein